MRRVVVRTLPSGRFCHVHPFHVCLKGTESVVLCRDEGDYDTMVKTMAVASRRVDVIIVIYSVMSNHFHVVILAEHQKDADRLGEEVKRVYSMWFSRKYGERGTLRRVQSSAIWLDNDWYVRNSLAYVPRNALDSGSNVGRYRWSGYSAMFLHGDVPRGRKVSGLSSREKERILHTGMDLDSVDWELDEDGCLLAASICDNTYLEQAFEGSQSFFLKTIGSLNVVEMDYSLVDAPRTRILDGDMQKYAEELSRRWYNSNLSDISLERKNRMIPYLYRTRRTSPAQLARVLGLSRERVEKAVTMLKGK